MLQVPVTVTPSTLNHVTIGIPTVKCLAKKGEEWLILNSYSCYISRTAVLLWLRKNNHRRPHYILASVSDAEIFPELLDRCCDSTPDWMIAVVFICERGKQECLPRMVKSNLVTYIKPPTTCKQQCLWHSKMIVAGVSAWWFAIIVDHWPLAMSQSHEVWVTSQPAGCLHPQVTLHTSFCPPLLGTGIHRPEVEGTTIHGLPGSRNVLLRTPTAGMPCALHQFSDMNMLIVCNTYCMYLQFYEHVMLITYKTCFGAVWIKRVLGYRWRTTL